MKLTITAQNMVVTPAITKRIEKKTETMGRYLRPDTEMLIKLRKEKKLRTVEITVPMGKNLLLRSEAAAEDNLFLAIDQALAKMERQIRKHRTKLGKNLREEIPDVPEFIEEDDDAAEEKDRKIVKRKTFPVRPMSVEDAMIEMELLGHNFFAFVNIDTEQTNVLYLRKDGDLGLLEPEV